MREKPGTQAKAAPVLRTFANLGFAPRFQYGAMAQVAEASGPGDGTPLGTGFVRLRDARIPWRIRYDEVLLVLEGEVTIQTAERTITAGPRDCIWLPEGTELVYEAEDALVFYAIHPADWASSTKESGA